MHAWRSWRAQLAAVLLLVVASGVALEVHLDKRVHRTPAASPAPAVSAPLPPFPDCSGDQARLSETDVQQQADGSFAGCLKVDAVTTGGYLVRAYAAVSKFVPSPVPDMGGMGGAMAVSPAEGPPGTLVTLSGPVPAVPPGGHLNDRANVCWDACTALSYWEQVSYSAGSPGRFGLSFRAPTVPWLTDKGVHPLVPGSYEVILPCFWVETAEKPKGECRSGERTSSFRLTGPGSSLCLAGQPCSALEVSPTEGPPGTAIAVRGWAPLVGLARWGSVHIQLRSALAATNALPTLASAPFQVRGGQDWASLGILHPASVLRSDVDAIGVDPANPRRFAYCIEGGIRLTADGGQSWSSISIEGALTASAATNYPLVPGYGTAPASCLAVALDPKQPATLYAEFSTVERNSGPPPYMYVAYYTRDSGATWHPVPVPKGSVMGAFGGFRADLSGVRALYTQWSDSLPPDQPAVAIQLSVDGGKTWSTATLPCPQAGPCVTLGTKTWARCMAVEGWESVLVSTDSGKNWTTANRIRSCWRVAEIVGLTDGRLVTLDGLDGSVLTLSEDGDRSWRSFALPQLPDQTDTVTPVGNLELLPDGRLLSVSLHWSLLTPGASAWCTVPGSPTGMGNGAAGPGSIAPLLIGDRFWWLDGWPATLHSFALGALHC